MKETRKLPLLDFLEVLQREYFISEIRAKFYYKQNDKAYYRKVAGHKKDKIDAIGAQNNIKTIFNSTEIYNKVKSEVYPVRGLPIFDLTKKDIENYYSRDSHVRCYCEGDMLIGHIVKTLNDYDKILVKIRGAEEERYFNQENVTRIL